MTVALNVTDAVNVGIYNALSTDATMISLVTATGVSVGFAPKNATFPYCCFQYVAGAGYTYSFSQRVIDNLVYVIKGVSEDDGGDSAGLIAARADLLLTDQHLTLGTGWGLMYLRREGDVEMQEPAGDHTYFHKGGRYRFIVQPQ